MLYGYYDDGSTISSEDYQQVATNIEDAVSRVLEEARAGRNLVFAPLQNGTDISEINDIAHEIRSKFSYLIVLGTGGSSMTGQALCGLYGARNRFIGNPTQVIFLDNIDSDTFGSFFEGIDIAECFFLVISKSGNTLETITQYEVCLSEVKRRLGKGSAKERFLVISDATDNSLRRLASEDDINILDHIGGIGGRFSIFTNVALLPASVIGLDIGAIVHGAQEVIDKLDIGSPAVRGAAHSFILEKRGIASTVFIPYIDRLKSFGEWFCQIWAESLGKGGHGTMAVNSLGTVYQHSQQQLYIDGARDKFFTFISLEYPPSARDKEEGSGSYYRERLDNAMQASCHAVMEVFSRHNLPMRHISLPKLDERSLGALAIHFIIETVLCGYMRGIDPYDQPAVEEAKIIASRMLSNT